MILLKEDALFLFSIFILSTIKAHASPLCNRTCGSNHLPYPFGFSSGCKIPLNCGRNGEMLVNNEFPVQNVTNDKIRIYIQTHCKRSIQSFQRLFTSNFAPTSTNAILLHKCSFNAQQSCHIRGIDVETHFQSLTCSTKSNISCLFNITTGDAIGFFAKSSHLLTNCQFFLSSVSSEQSYTSGLTSLDVQVLDLGWWLQGNKCHCSNHAHCSGVVITPAGPGYRCQCEDGFHGDGYPAGSGCQEASCNLAKYLSGQCGGATRIPALIGGIAFMVTLVSLCCYIRRRFTSKAKVFTKLRLSEATGIDLPIYPYKEIEKATNSFSERQRLGTGAYGTVYAAKLHDLWVAIKRIKHRDNDSNDQVINEIKLISSVNHPHLVRLLGCSIENGEQILVYEFMPNGTLCQHLQRDRGDGLTWLVRLSIACETAQAIAHLHSAIHPPIYHRDIKSCNILLDYNFRSKVADFGLSRLGMTETSHISTAPQGTPGYLDPQYHQNFHLSDKSDVYSFGVVLVEMITAMKVVDFSRPQNEVNLAALATDRIGKGRLDEIIDPFLDIHSDAWTLSSVYKVAELAFMCLAFHRDMRPSMVEVADELEQIRLNRWASSEEINGTPSSNETSCSSLSNISEKPLSSTDKIAWVEKSRGLFTEASSKKSMEMEKDNSPVSVQNPWLSAQSSISSSSRINTVIQSFSLDV